MVATHGLRQLQADVSDAEEAELRRLEDGATAGGDGDRRASPQSGGDDNSGEEAGSVGTYGCRGSVSVDGAADATAGSRHAGVHPTSYTWTIMNGTR